MAFDRRPILTVFADKIAVRQYVEQTIGSQYLTRQYSVSRDPAAIDWEVLPEEYVCKPNHMSGAVVLVTRRAAVVSNPAHLWKKARTKRVEIHPNQAVPEHLEKLCEFWLAQNFEWRPGRLPEWAYRNIQPGILVEELLPSEQHDEPPQDCRFFVFNGRVDFIRATQRETTDPLRYSLTPDWQSLPFSVGYPDATGMPRRPKNLELMVDLATRLGQGIDFIRVDLYDLGDRVVFGELTNYPSGGLFAVMPPEYGALIGERWRIDGYGPR